jgi:hypothetical protein
VTLSNFGKGLPQFVLLMTIFVVVLMILAFTLDEGQFDSLFATGSTAKFVMTGVLILGWTLTPTAS